MPRVRIEKTCKGEVLTRSHLYQQAGAVLAVPVQVIVLEVSLRYALPGARFVKGVSSRDLRFRAAASLPTLLAGITSS